MNLRHFLRMAKWARNPPPLSRVILVLSVLGICLALFALEWAGFWPDGLGLNPRGGGMPKIRALP